MQEKESIMVVLLRIEKSVPRDHCVWHHSAKPRDAKQCPSDGFFYPHLKPMKDSYIPFDDARRKRYTKTFCFI